MYYKAKYKNNHEALADFLAEHKSSGMCEQNYEGFSGGMEKQMAINMWKSSVEKLKMRYTTMISDGDSSTHKAPREENPYGAGEKKTKLEKKNV